MAHYGITSIPVEGRALPLIALGHELKSRGHEITVIGYEIHQRMAEASGLNFLPLVSPERRKAFNAHFPPSKKRLAARLMLAAGNRILPNDYKDTTGLIGLAMVANGYSIWTKVDLVWGESALSEARIDALIASDTSYAAGTLAERQGIPFYSICTGIPIVHDYRLPPDFVHWDYANSKQEILRNRLGWKAWQILAIPTLLELNAWRQFWGMPKYSRLGQTVSKLLYLSQMQKGLDFPLPDNGRTVTYLGAISHNRSRKNVDFPWDKLDSKPVVYASTGTICTGEDVLKCVAEACADLPVTLIITRGGNKKLGKLEELPGNPIVVDYAPQLEVLKRASLMITHGGVNSVVEALHQGVPLIVVPFVFDQPGSGARVARCGAGVVIKRSSLTKNKLRETIQEVLGNEMYKKCACKLRDAAPHEGGTAKAACLIESDMEQRLETTATEGNDDSMIPTYTEFEVVLSDGYCLKGLQYKAEQSAKTSETAICIHGFGNDVTSWHFIARALQRNGINAVSFDLRGHGLSAHSSETHAGKLSPTIVTEKTWPGLRPELFAKDVLAVCDYLSISEAFIVSQSYGGMVGLELLRMDLEQRRFQKLFAFAPPFVSQKAPYRDYVPHVYDGIKIIVKLGAHIGFNRKRILYRKDYPGYNNTPDIYIPRIVSECKNLSWVFYSWKFMENWMAVYGKQNDWKSERALPIYLFAAKHDKLVDNKHLVKISEYTGWPLDWIDCGHVGIATTKEYAETFVQMIMDKK
jgi:zeaxanthin glucosyltransferase